MEEEIINKREVEKKGEREREERTDKEREEKKGERRRLLPMKSSGLKRSLSHTCRVKRGGRCFSVLSRL